MIAALAFEWGRLVNFGPLHWLLLIAASAAVIALVIYFYIRDCVEVGATLAVVLITLRLSAFLGLLWIFLQPQMRVEHEEVQNSRVLLLGDISLSMAKRDEDASQRRVDQVVEALAGGRLLPELRRTHDVSVFTFDSQTVPVATLARQNAPVAAPAENSATGAGEGSTPRPASRSQAAAADEAPIDWARLLEPKGRETRLGQALRQLINEHRTAPLAGIVVITDGRSNAGVDPISAAALAKSVNVPIHLVGVGSAQPPLSLRIANFQAPARAYPGDKFAVSALIQATGLAGQAVQVELYARPDGAPASEARLVQTETVTLGADGEMAVANFQMSPEETGRQTLSMKLVPPTAALKEGRETSDERSIEIVEQKTRVLLFAGGPNRDYVFLRNQLRRDASMTVDVLLQSAQEGMSQDANKILSTFPSNKEEMYDYDCIVAFDPDWSALEPEQIDALEEWVAKGAGGLIVIPGPVNADRWIHESKDDKLRKIRALYPVQFEQQFAVLGSGEFGNTKAFPLKFTPEGLNAEFLWLGDGQLESERAWNDFEGIFGYYAVREAKPLTTTYAYFSDPSTNNGSGLPIYMAGHFFGAGRVFYLGSGELWRLRKLDEAHFEQLYTKLVRYVSQGTLLRGSKRGVLLVEQDRYMLGDSVSVRAQLKDAQLEPLDARNVTLEIINPDQRLNTQQLTVLPNEPGTFAGQFPVYQEGNYRLQLRAPDSDDVLTWAIDVRLPDLENENTQRNDPLLAEIAQATGGRYYLGASRLADVDSEESLVKHLPDMKRITVHSDRPQSLWDNSWTLFFICGVLSLEWLIRRLAKLA